MLRRSLIAALLLAANSGAQVPTEIKVEIDWMADEWHSHQPSQAVLDALVDMFACQGIQLTLDLSNEIDELPIMRCPDPDDPDQNFFTCFGVDSFFLLKAVNKNNDSTWHYCIFGHQYNIEDSFNSSGLAESLADDFIVTLGVFAETDFQQAGTFAHELGHNLGLSHYAPATSPLGRGPYAPNYASVMSYQYQLNGVRSQMECKELVGDVHRLKDLDYSHGRMPMLQELFLDEETGLGIHPTDWNCNGTIDVADHTFDIDGERDWCAAPGGVGLVHDRNDWAEIVDFNDLGPLALGPASYEICLDASSNAQYLGDPSSCATLPTLATEGCSNGKMVWVDPTHPSVGSGPGSDPYRHINRAVAFSPSGSVLYLQPGTHFNSSPSALVVDKALVLAGPGGAVIDP